MSPHDRVEARSLRLHEAVAERIEAEPALVERARVRVASWLANETVARPYALAWETLLAGPLPRLLRALRERSPAMHDLRQVSPFAGVLDARTRWRLRREVSP